MDEHDILTSITAMVAQERALRDHVASRTVDGADAHARLRAVEVSLDQSWDLLRQRRARIEFDRDPDDVQARPADVVEGYWS